MQHTVIKILLNLYLHHKTTIKHQNNLNLSKDI